MEKKLIWPETDCTGREWQPADSPDKYRVGYGYSSYRNCNYDGSIHPADLYAMRDVVKLGGSDWKYGWPHKMYVEGYPSNLVGHEASYESGYTTYKECLEVRERHKKTGKRVEIFRETKHDYATREYEDGRRVDTPINSFEYPNWNYRVFEPASATEHAKFYTEHIQLITDPDTLATFLQWFNQASGIEFAVEQQSGKLKYKAPYRGFQL
jgi:hypothetical protein